MNVSSRDVVTLTPRTVYVSCCAKYIIGLKTQQMFHSGFNVMMLFSLSVFNLMMMFSVNFNGVILQFNDVQNVQAI